MAKADGIIFLSFWESELQNLERPWTRFETVNRRLKENRAIMCDRMAVMCAEVKNSWAINRRTPEEELLSPERVARPC